MGGGGIGDLVGDCLGRVVEALECIRDLVGEFGRREVEALVI